MRQADAFMHEEGNKWLERNRAKMAVDTDPVIMAIKRANIRPRRVLEVGCSNGWRLFKLSDEYGCQVNGIEPSATACNEAIKLVHTGTADDLGFDTDTFDVVIYGFCLYLCDREDLFKIALEGDRVLRDGGHLIIYDFYTDRHYSNIYSHNKALRSYKMNHSKLWLGNPAYHVKMATIMGDGDDATHVTILKKNLKETFPLRQE